MASRTPARAGIRCGPSSANAIERSRPTSGGTGRPAEREPVTLAAVLDDIAAVRAGAVHACRLLDGGSPGAAVRGRAPGACAAAGADRREPGDRRSGRAGAAPARRRAARRRARALEHRGVRGALGTGRRCSRGNRTRCSPPCGRTGCATRPPGWRERCVASAPARCRRCGSGWMRSRCPWCSSSGSATRSSGRIATAMAEMLPSVEIVIVPGVGHAVHLEAPRRVAEIVGRSG